MRFINKPIRLLNCIKRNKLVLRNYAGLSLWHEELTSDVKQKIEGHWASKLNNEKFNENDKTRDKYYVLSMIPYPSGRLHMGHVRVYAISDTVARFQRMNGKNVIHPIGWDAFGLPAENAAMERNIAPDMWTKENIKHMKDQMRQLGCSFEWDRELATCDPGYYKWTQELFLKLFDVGLAYQKQAEVNWDPVDKTVLADEQVDENGCSWRSGAKVEKKLLKQWFIKTTKFAKDLLDGLDDPILQDWRDVIKLQKHWIGECNGIALDFKLLNTAGGSNEFITLWTDRPEYVDQACFVAVSRSHLLAKGPGQNLDEQTKLLDAKVVNPFTQLEIGIYATDAVEFLEQTNMHLGLPSKEEDKYFCYKYNIPYTKIIEPPTDAEIEVIRLKVIAEAKSLNIGGHYTSAKLRDWLISRQRYWGTPIPIIHCGTCGPQPVPRNQLPVELPKSNNSEWSKTQCPKCGGHATREMDTMDTFVDSSWYYLRFLNTTYANDMFDAEKAKSMSPVDLYIGGKEHAVLHLYYARFMSHFLHSLGLIPEREPFKRLLVQGMVMGRSFRIKGTGKYLAESNVNIVDAKRNKATCKETGEPVVMQWEKMSKSKHNGVDPEDTFKEFGVDTTRLLILGDVAPTSSRNWNRNTFPGVLNWQRRLWLTIGDFLKHRNDLPKMIPEHEFNAQEDYMFDSRNYYVKGVTFNYCDSQQISVAMSKMQGLTNSIRKAPPAVIAHGLQYERALACQIIVLAPMAPHFASELWSGFQSAPGRLNTTEIFWDRDVLEQEWPVIDQSYNMDLVCQVNGCENAVVKIPRKELEVLAKEEAIALAFKQREVQEGLRNRSIVDVTYVIRKNYENIVNIITSHPPAKKQQEEIKNEIS